MPLSERISQEQLTEEQRRYLEAHELKRPMRVRHIWALGVGAVITGEYFGWNFGLPLAGPVGMLIATLIVCLLYLTWVLALSELSVAMPFAGGPLAYGRRAAGPTLGFFMAWSMFLECLFATIGTAIATGGYASFVLRPDATPEQAALPTLIFGILTALVFMALGCWGVKEQSRVMVLMTYGAIVGLVWFWLGTAHAFRWDRVVTTPLLPDGWTGVLAAVPYALWWLVIIETVALAAEETHEPHRTIPVGLVWAQLTLIVLVVLTWLFACGAADYQKTGAALYPLGVVFRDVWPSAGARWFVLTFSVVAMCGMVASYNGMIYATSRQAFSLGRAGYLPAALGSVHPTRRTPHVSLAVWTVATVAFIVAGYFFSAVAAAT
ncbi:MAG: amino acid permease, partial [Planctomycetes bacterium]|nr:amino acid permease [Planctomycetota bacterium]